MTGIIPRCPSPRNPNPNGLWSLLDMLEIWAYFYTHLGLALGYSEAQLIKLRDEAGKANSLATYSGHPILIEPDDPIVKAIFARCDEFLKLADRQELGAIPRNVVLLRVKIEMAQRKPPLRKKLNVEELLNDVARIKNDFLYILSERWYYSVAPLDSELYGKPDLFGPKVAKKFGFAGRDIEHAGNCLALSEPTACVFHLMRAMEGVVRYLAKRLDVIISPKDTWGGILKHMDQGIEKLPEKTAAQKRKKEKWAECRAQLWQLKQAWRDNSMHAKVTYDVREARQVLEHSRTFMQHLATL